MCQAAAAAATAAAQPAPRYRARRPAENGQALPQVRHGHAKVRGLQQDVVRRLRGLLVSMPGGRAWQPGVGWRCRCSQACQARRSLLSFQPRHGSVSRRPGSSAAAGAGGAARRLMGTSTSVPATASCLTRPRSCGEGRDVMCAMEGMQCLGCSVWDAMGGIQATTPP